MKPIELFMKYCEGKNLHLTTPQKAAAEEILKCHNFLAMTTVGTGRTTLLTTLDEFLSRSGPLVDHPVASIKNIPPKGSK